jgi:hypothetical protein
VGTVKVSWSVEATVAAEVAARARAESRSVSQMATVLLRAGLGDETPVSEAAIRAADASATMRGSAPVGEGLEAPATGVGVDDSPSPESSPGPVSRLLEGRGR